MNGRKYPKITQRNYKTSFTGRAFVGDIFVYAASFSFSEVSSAAQEQGYLVKSLRCGDPRIAETGYPAGSYAVLVIGRCGTVPSRPDVELNSRPGQPGYWIFEREGVPSVEGRIVVDDDGAGIFIPRDGGTPDALAWMKPGNWTLIPLTRWRKVQQVDEGWVFERSDRGYKAPENDPTERDGWRPLANLWFAAVDELRPWRVRLVGAKLYDDYEHLQGAKNMTECHLRDQGLP